MVEKHHQGDKDSGQLNILPEEPKKFTLDIDEIKRKNVASLRGERSRSKFKRMDCFIKNVFKKICLPNRHLKGG